MKNNNLINEITEKLNKLVQEEVMFEKIERELNKLKLHPIQEQDKDAKTRFDAPGKGTQNSNFSLQMMNIGGAYDDEEIKHFKQTGAQVPISAAEVIHKQDGLIGYIIKTRGDGGANKYVPLVVDPSGVSSDSYVAGAVANTYDSKKFPAGGEFAGPHLKRARFTFKHALKQLLRQQEYSPTVADLSIKVPGFGFKKFGAGTATAGTAAGKASPSKQKPSGKKKFPDTTPTRWQLRFASAPKDFIQDINVPAGVAKHDEDHEPKFKGKYAPGTAILPDGLMMYFARWVIFMAGGPVTGPARAKETRFTRVRIYRKQNTAGKRSWIFFEEKTKARLDTASWPTPALQLMFFKEIEKKLYADRPEDYVLPSETPDFSFTPIIYGGADLKAGKPMGGPQGSWPISRAGAARAFKRLGGAGSPREDAELINALDVKMMTWIQRYHSKALAAQPKKPKQEKPQEKPQKVVKTPGAVITPSGESKPIKPTKPTKAGKKAPPVKKAKGLAGYPKADNTVSQKIKELQQYLIQNGYAPSSQMNGTDFDDGVFGSQTAAAIRNSYHGRKPYGNK